MKTAVEWFFEEIDKTYWDYMTTEQQREIFEKAKEMEKKQITNAFDISKYGDVGTGDDYYNYLMNDYSE